MGPASVLFQCRITHARLSLWASIPATGRMDGHLPAFRQDHQGRRHERGYRNELAARRETAGDRPTSPLVSEPSASCSCAEPLPTGLSCRKHVQHGHVVAAELDHHDRLIVDLVALHDGVCDVEGLLVARRAGAATVCSPSGRSPECAPRLFKGRLTFVSPRAPEALSPTATLRGRRVTWEKEKRIQARRGRSQKAAAGWAGPSSPS